MFDNRVSFRHGILFASAQAQSGAANSSNGSEQIIKNVKHKLLKDTFDSASRRAFQAGLPPAETLPRIKKAVAETSQAVDIQFTLLKQMNHARSRR